jgi:hypothetical protein
LITFITLHHFQLVFIFQQKINFFFSCHSNYPTNIQKKNTSLPLTHLILFLYLIRNAP